MTLEDLKTGNNSRAMLVSIMCLERGMKDKETIADYIKRSYLNYTKEFPGRKPRGEKYIKRLTDSTLKYLEDHDFLS